MEKSFKGKARILRKDGRYTTREWRGTFTNLGQWIREREKFLRNIYHIKKIDLNIGPDGCVTLECERPEGKYEGRHLCRIHCFYEFTPIQ